MWCTTDRFCVNPQLSGKDFAADARHDDFAEWAHVSGGSVGGSGSFSSRTRPLGGGASHDIPSKMSTIPNYDSESLVTSSGDIIAQ